MTRKGVILPGQSNVGLNGPRDAPPHTPYSPGQMIPFSFTTNKLLAYLPLPTVQYSSDPIGPDFTFRSIPINLLLISLPHLSLLSASQIRR